MYVYNTDSFVVKAAAGPLPICATYNLNIHFSIVIILVSSRSRTLKTTLRESFILSEDKTAFLPRVSIRINGTGARRLILSLFSPELFSSRSTNAHICYFCLCGSCIGRVCSRAWVPVHFRLVLRAHSGHTLNPLTESDRILCVVARTGQVSDLLLFAPQVLPLLLANAHRATSLRSHLGSIGLVCTRARIIILILCKLAALDDRTTTLHSLTKLFFGSVITRARVFHSHLDLILPDIRSSDITNFAIGRERTYSLFLSTFILAWAWVIVLSGLILRPHIGYSLDALAKGRFVGIISRAWILSCNLN